MILTLEEALAQSWSRETSSDPEKWTAENPAWGQCAVTAAIVNDYLGGKVVWAEAQLPNGTKISHYFNRISSDGEKSLDRFVDFTSRQFPNGTIIPLGIEKKKEFTSTREYILSYPKTAERYELLKDRVKKILKK